MVNIGDVKLKRDGEKNIVGYLGKGTFGIVYTRSLPELGEVAVKRIQLIEVEKTELDRESMTEKFEHPNILKLFFIRQDEEFM